MRDDKEKLEKILDSADRIREYTKDGEDEFFAKPLIQDAVIRNLQIIGEAIKELSNELKDQNPDIEWRNASRMRDKLTHDYFEVNYDIVWDTVENHIPPFRDKIEDIHQRLVYRVSNEREKSPELEQRLKEKDNPRPNPEDALKTRQLEKKEERDLDDNLSS
ncbi:MAG: DUF86 domain-containing protein [Candidatus Melainabacteria bacterium]|nr:DUF86 domain-containing protein [Candidatus Melainabacteria bacterium]